jgi:group I intron endonuclease
MENKYYVYAFLDSSKSGKFTYNNIILDYEPFYIGKGCGDRIKSSLNDRESPFKVKKIKSLKNNGIDIISIKLFENLTNEDSLKIEIELIKKIGRRDLGLGPLTNLTDGGDGRLHSPHSEETKNKISLTKKKQAVSITHSEETKNFLRKINSGESNPMYGNKHTDDIKEKQSIRVSGLNHPMYGKKHSEDTLNKIKESRKEFINQDYLNKISKERNSKVVLQYTLDGIFIAEYESIKIAAKEIGISESLIGKTCRGQIKNPRKYIFKFKDDKDSELKNSFNIKLGDSVTILDSEYILVKRNKTSFVVKDENDLTFSFRKKDFNFIWDKKSI